MLTYAVGMLLTINNRHAFVEIDSGQIAFINIKINSYYFYRYLPCVYKSVILVKKIYSSKLKNVEIWFCFCNNKMMKIVLHSNDENLYEINKCI
jgi:hypothetical protein